jgi:membrane-bound lytic murein transglycosylase D
MQYKIIVSALLLLTPVASLKAQQNHNAPKKHVIRVSGVDTALTNNHVETPYVKTAAVISQPAQVPVITVATPAPAKPVIVTAPVAAAPLTPTTSLLASNIPEENPTNEIKKSLYLPVPLAGEKAYFGEKNEYVNDYVRRYLELHNKTLGSVHNSSPKPFSVIDNVLEKKQLPKELKYLAVIESALNNNAVSHAGAVGPWQLMSSTAKMLGLSVTRKHDDRRDWAKSTAAATKYLELLYSQLNDWLLVIAAYNSGPTPVQKAIARTGSHNFWDIKQYLPHETQGHVLAFIATASIFENLSKFIDLGSIPVDFKFGKDEDPLPSFKKDIVGKTLTTSPASSINNPGVTTVTTNAATPGTPAGTMVVKKLPYTEDELKLMAIVRIKDPISLEYMAQELHIDKNLLIRWNPDYDMFVLNTYPTPFYNLRFPKEKLDVFLSKKDEMIKRSKTIFEQGIKS